MEIEFSTVRRNLLISNVKIRREIQFKHLSRKHNPLETFNMRSATCFLTENLITILETEV